LLARQHPGESVSSYVLEGFLKKIIKEIEFLKKYELIVIPMVNPDGVIYGNFRTNLAGFDLNRQWRNPDKWLHR
jgi:murein tripeptide amidase MpaA